MAARSVITVSDRQVRKSAFEVEAVGQIMSTTKQLAKQMAEYNNSSKEIIHKIIIDLPSQTVQPVAAHTVENFVRRPPLKRK